MPTASQTAEVTAELSKRAKLPESAAKVIDGLPKGMHPMTQLCIGICALQTQSKFAKAYSAGVHKNKYWISTLDDTLDLIAQLPSVAARIYQNTYNGGKHIAAPAGLDWSATFAHQLGHGKNQQFVELMRLYLTIHADHEGGNVSAHATHLVGSALSDPYLSLAAGMAGLAGPLHGLVRWRQFEHLGSISLVFCARKKKLILNLSRRPIKKFSNGCSMFKSRSASSRPMLRSRNSFGTRSTLAALCLAMVTLVKRNYLWFNVLL